MNQIKINTNFDGGSIIAHDISNPSHLKFKVRNDTNSEFAQWFYFQLNNIKSRSLTISLVDLDKTAYTKGWINYNVCASYDNKNWFRIKSNFTANELSWQINSTTNTIYFAYFEPYSYSRHLNLIAKSNSLPNTMHEIIGLTTQNRPLDLLTIGNPSTAKYKIWIIARQHPGETMAQWLTEGLIDKLLDSQDSSSLELLRSCVFYIVPNMNPDGTYLGNLRTNSNGVNLNRQWQDPNPETCPEVYYVRNKMLETGVNIFFDIHGDEEIPYVFTAGCQENPSFSQHQARLSEFFEQIFPLINPDYQTKHGYTADQFGPETLTMATNWVGDKFNCLAYTLELPFKDNANLPDSKNGWNGKRSYLFGQSLVTGINLLINQLKK